MNQHWNKMKILLFILLLMLLNYSCDKDAVSLNKLDSDKLKSTWVLYKFIDKTTNESYSLPDDYSSEITFHGENCISVIGPCNSGPGKYKIDDNKISITKLAMTERGCNIIGYEEKYTDNLSGTYIVKGDTLTILSDFDTDLVLIKADSTKMYDCYDF